MERPLDDAALPAALRPPEARSRAQRGVSYSSAAWTPAALAGLAEHLAGAGARTLETLPVEALRRAWLDATAALLDPTSSERRRLEASLPRLTGLSPAGTAAALETVLGGVSGAAAEALFDAARGRRGGGLVTVVLASNLPALAVQPLLPALALARPVLLKSASAEPLFAPVLLRALVEREPRLDDAVAAVTWPGGERDLEEALLERSETVIAYGEDATLADLRRRARGRLIGYGAKISVAIVAEDASAAAVAPGLARDVALFDQRGCLSPQAIYTTGPAEELAAALAGALESVAHDLPPGPPAAGDLASVQQLRAEADLRGLARPELPPAAGTVIVDLRPELRPGPGLRTVRIHPVASLGEVLEHLEPWRGRLQGAALAGRARELVQGLEELGVTRCAAPGELQSPDASWHNGGRHPVELLAASS